MLPIVWLALFGSRAQLILGLAAMAATLLIPFLLFGEPRYPSTAWRSTLLWLVVATLTGLAIQSLVARQRTIARPAVERAPERDRDRDHRHRRRRDDHGVQPRRRAHARLLGVRGRRQGDAGAHPPARGDGGARRRDSRSSAAAPRRSRSRYTYVRKDGGHVPVSLTLTVERDPTGAVSGYLGVATDIGERLRAEAALKAERDFSAAVVDTAGSLVMVLDPQRRIQRFNRACERLTGRTEAEVLGLVPSEEFVANARGGAARRRAPAQREARGLPDRLRGRVARRGRPAAADRVVEQLPVRRGRPDQPTSSPPAPTSPSAARRCTRRWRPRARSPSSWPT